MLSVALSVLPPIPLVALGSSAPSLALAVAPSISSVAVSSLPLRGSSTGGTATLAAALLVLLTRLLTPLAASLSGRFSPLLGGGRGMLSSLWGSILTRRPLLWGFGRSVTLPAGLLVLPALLALVSESLLVLLLVTGDLLSLAMLRDLLLLGESLVALLAGGARLLLLLSVPCLLARILRWVLVRSPLTGRGRLGARPGGQV